MLSFRLPDVVTHKRITLGNSSHTITTVKRCRNWHLAVNVSDVVRFHYCAERAAHYFQHDYLFLLAGNLKAVRRAVLDRRAALIEPAATKGEGWASDLLRLSRRLFNEYNRIRRLSGQPPIGHRAALALLSSRHDHRLTSDFLKAWEKALTDTIDGIIGSRRMLADAPRFAVTDNDLFSVGRTWTQENRRIADSYLRSFKLYRRSRPITMQLDDHVSDAVLRSIVHRRTMRRAERRLEVLSHVTIDEKQAVLKSLSVHIKSFRWPEPAPDRRAQTAPQPQTPKELSPH